MTSIRLGVLGLCAVFGLIAFGASGAQAEGTWLILNAKGEIKTGVEYRQPLDLKRQFGAYSAHGNPQTQSLILMY